MLQPQNFLPTWIGRYSKNPKIKTSTSTPEPIIFIVPEQSSTEEQFDVLLAISLETGFPTDFSTAALKIAKFGFTSVRTSADAIPRGSFAISLDDGTSLRLGDPKTTGVASKSKWRGMGKAKILWDPKFFDKNNPKAYDPKDNNSLSMFPDRLDDVPLLNDTTGLLQLKTYLSPDVHEAKIDPDTGLIYCSINVPAYDSKHGFSKQKYPKHYCQEAETLRSIFDNLDNKIYQAENINQGYLYFTDDNTNQCRIDLNNLKLPTEIRNDPEYKEAIKKLARVKNITALRSMIGQLSFKNLPWLELCHAAIFTSQTPYDANSYVPVLVQTGDTGEAIIRDADFEHFYKHSLVPPLALKSFNGSMQPSSGEDHLNGLILLEIRLNSATLGDFIQELDNFITVLIEHTSTKIYLDDFIIGEIKEKHADFPILAHNEYDLSNLTPEQRRIVLLAKYNDLTTLDEKMPFINYSTEEFNLYRLSVTEAHNYYIYNSLALRNLGESSAQDLIFLSQLDHRMATHGDEGGHPKSKPEDFAKITTYYNGKVIITHNEAQYLKLLFSNPEMLDYQIISIHPYWLRNLELEDKKSEDYNLSKGWLDLLTIQALKHCLVLQNYNDHFLFDHADLIKTYDIFVQSFLLNMPRRYVAEAGKPGDAAMIAKIRQVVEKHFSEVKKDLLVYKNLMLDKHAAHPMMQMINEIYANSSHMATGQEIDKYRVYASKSTSKSRHAL